MERRLLLQRALGVTAAAGVAGPLEALEAIRHTLDDVISARSVDDWEEVAWDYGHDLLTLPPAEWLDELAQDALAVRRLLGRTTNEYERAGLQRVTAQMAWYVSNALQSIGQTASARRWQRTAVAAADRSGDNELRVLIRGRQACAMTFESPQRAVVTAERAIALADDHNAAGAGRCLALQGRAQALAVLGHQDAAGTVEELNATFEALPSAVKTDRVLGWSEMELRYAQSLVYTRTGDPRAAETQDVALASADLWGGGVKFALQRAGWLVRTGDPTEGLRQATHVLTELPPQYRNTDVLHHARYVDHALPTGADSSRAAVEYRELLALPSGN